VGKVGAVASSIVMDRRVKRFGWRLRFGEEPLVALLFAPTAKGRCLTFKLIIKGRDPGVHATACFEDSMVSSHLTVEGSKNVHIPISRADLNALADMLREDAGRFRSRWLEEYGLSGKVLAPTNEALNFLWELMGEFVKLRSRGLYIDIDLRRIENIVEVLGPGRVLTLENLSEAVRRIPYYRTFYTPDRRLVIVESSGGAFEAYAFRSEFFELLRGNEEERLHPEDSFNIFGEVFGRSVEVLCDVLGVRRLFTELWRRGLL
jgi:hypothetical protein